MTEELKRAIKALTSKIGPSTTPDEALKFTQGALNLAHVLGTLDSINKT